MTFQALLFCPDEKTARVTTQVLTELEFSVEPCTEPFAAVKKLMGQHFDAIVVDSENEQNASLLFKSARNSSSNQAALAVALVEGQAGVASAFRIGANLVLTKPINVEQAKSTLRVARGLLRKGTDGAKPAGAPAAAVPGARPAIPPVVTRPVAAPPSAPKPAFTGLQGPKVQPTAAVAKTSVDAGSIFDVEQDPSPAPEPAEEILLESMEENSPAMTAPRTSRPSSLPSAAEAANKQISKLQVSKSSAQIPAPVTDSRSLFTRVQGGAAAAPAPAKHSQASSPSAIEKGFPAPAFENTPKPLTKAAVAATASAFPTSATLPVPTFAGLDGEDAESEGGSKKRFLVGIGLILLVVVGYFGYTKFHKTVPQPATQVQPQNAAPAISPAPGTESPLAEPAPLTQAPQQMKMESAPATHASASTKSAAPKSNGEEGEEGSDTPEVVVTHPAAKTMVVKTDVARRAASQESEETSSSEVPAPPALGNMSSTDQSAISNIVQAATPASVPRVAPAQMLKVSQGVTQGLLLKRVQPNYPHQAMQMHIQGAVQLQAVISKNGSISSINVLSGDPILARAAVDAVKQWKYKPYFLDGEPVDIQTQITVNFKLP
ncbi:MAG TPA: TonB family protein [Terriglobales bacterium]|nr:TonB family protein [Terriglobales bacterium]